MSLLRRINLFKDIILSKRYVNIHQLSYNKSPFFLERMESHPQSCEPYGCMCQDHLFRSISCKLDIFEHHCQLSKPRETRRTFPKDIAPQHAKAFYSEYRTFEHNMDTLHAQYYSYLQGKSRNDRKKCISSLLNVAPISRFLAIF